MELHDGPLPLPLPSCRRVPSLYAQGYGTAGEPEYVGRLLWRCFLLNPKKNRQYAGRSGTKQEQQNILSSTGSAS